RDIVCIPMSALRGDNITGPSENTPWYDGPSLIGYLETVEIDERLQDAPFGMPVQWVNRPNLDFRGFSGQIVGGAIRPGDPVRLLPGGRQTTVERLVTQDGDLDQAGPGSPTTVTLA